MITALVQRKFSIYSTFLDLTLQLEDEVKDGETHQQALIRLHKELEETAAELRRMAGNRIYDSDRLPASAQDEFRPHAIPIINRDEPETNVGHVLHCIQNAPTLEELKTYKRVASAGDKTLYDAYNLRIKQLTNG